MDLESEIKRRNSIWYEFIDGEVVQKRYRRSYSKKKAQRRDERKHIDWLETAPGNITKSEGDELLGVKKG